MRGRLALIALCSACLLPGVIIDRIAIVVGNSIIKDSDIANNVRLTEFLNGQPLNMSEALRKEAANRLIDQHFIRTEIRSGDYQASSPADAEKQLSALERQRFHGKPALHTALEHYGLTELNVKTEFQWQLTVLSFIEARFRPAAYVSDAEVQAYYDQHARELERQHPGKATVSELRGTITDLIEQEKTNKLFFSWLDEQRKQAKIQYREASLQ